MTRGVKIVAIENADRGRTKWRPILRHGDAADSGSSLDGQKTAKLSELDLPATPSSARVESEAPSERLRDRLDRQTNRPTHQYYNIDYYILLGSAVALLM